jgi:hypothetical protein
MNFVNGKIVTDEECESILENIDETIMQTLQKPPLDINIVINACDSIVKNIGSLNIIKKLPELGVSPRLAEIYMGQIKQMLNADSIRKRLKIELGDNFDKPRELTYLHSKSTAVQTVAPLGVLFHITAGNVDGLPFVSLLDGLLTGNINIVKLPEEEGGITVSLLEELFRIAPVLSEYVYVFDYSSRDIEAIKKLSNAADAIVVWGGDEAVSAVRRLADPNTKIIEWGHKISFAYITKEGVNKASLEKLALNICLTNQLFCSSCQGIFLDTDDIRDVFEFCEKFLPVLERTAKEIPFVFDAATKLFIQAQVTLELYHRQIENQKNDHRIFRGENCSIMAYSDSKLETSIMYRNIWVKPLKRDRILRLRPYKNYLQTAALICAAQEYDELSLQLLQTGIVKISDGFEMSNYAFGEAHDGIFTLRCYTKLVSVQNQFFHPVTDRQDD